MKRRHFLIAGGLISIGSYVNHRALRYPRLSFEPKPLSSRHQSEASLLDLRDLIALKHSEISPIQLRAIAPEPALTVHPNRNDGRSLTIRLSNIAAKAVLRVSGESKPNVHESVEGIHRTVEINNLGTKSIDLSWALAGQEIKFAGIGDSGGGIELDWCLQRAAALNADFILHLGDLNYGTGEYDRAIEQFNLSAIPVYVTIGNHDFNDSGLIYQQFLNQIGPQNHSFVVVGTRFVNVDTAVNLFPAYSGNRGRLIRELKASSKQFDDTVVFTHKPFVDSREGYTHDISGVGEKTWLRQSMQDIGARDLLCGHVHHSSERDYEGIRQWTAGEGLGHEDLVHQKLVSKILIGNTALGQAVEFQWQDLEMPWEMHQSHTHEEKLKDYNNLDQLEWYLQTIKS